LGEQPLYENGQKGGGGTFLHSKTSPLIQKKKEKLKELTDFAALGSPFFAFLIPFCSIIHLQ